MRIEELIDGPKPFPLQCGFSMGIAYRALGLYNPSETSDAYFVLSNDRDEIWFICNRHVRTIGLQPNDHRLRFSLLLSPGFRSRQGSSLKEPAVIDAAT